jgi:hypothetical protein
MTIISDMTTPIRQREIEEEQNKKFGKLKRKSWN